MAPQPASTTRGAHTSQLAATLADAAESLATGTRSWALIAPAADAVDRALIQADAIARALRQLRMEVANGAN